MAHFKPYCRLRVTDRFDPGIPRDPAPYPNTDGAKTFSLHAPGLKTFRKNGHSHVRFKLGSVDIEAPLVARKAVKSSDGEEEDRPFVELEICLGGRRKKVLF